MQSSLPTVSRARLDERFPSGLPHEDTTGHVGVKPQGPRGFHREETTFPDRPFRKAEPPAEDAGVDIVPTPSDTFVASYVSGVHRLLEVTGSRQRTLLAPCRRLPSRPHRLASYGQLARVTWLMSPQPQYPRPEGPSGTILG